MTQAIITAVAALLGSAVGAYLMTRHKSDELFLVALQYLKGGAQPRSLGIAALELCWAKRRHRKAVASILARLAVYLLVESEHHDSPIEAENLKEIMRFLMEKDRLKAVGGAGAASIANALGRKRQNAAGKNRGVCVENEEVMAWIEKVQRLK